MNLYGIAYIQLNIVKLISPQIHAHVYGGISDIQNNKVSTKSDYPC